MRVIHSSFKTRPLQILSLGIVVVLTVGIFVTINQIQKRQNTQGDAAATNINFNLGAESRIFTAAQFNKGSYPDTHTSFIKDATNQFRVFMAAGRDMYLFTGTNGNDLVPFGGGANPKAVLGPSFVEGAPDENYASAGEVFVDPTNPNRLLAFYHGENHCAQGWTTFVASILLASSLDGGQTWTRNGEVISGFNEQPCASAGRPTGAGELSAIKIGSYYYIYFITWAPGIADEIHMARVPVDQIFNPSAYQKWNNGSFSTPGIGGTSTAVMKRDANQGMTFVSNPGVSWNTYLQSYLSIARANNGFYFYTSPDGINWSTPKKIAGTDSYIYPSLMDFSQNSDMTTDQNFELWYGRTIPEGYHVAFRKPVTLTADNVPANTSTPTPVAATATSTPTPLTTPFTDITYTLTITVPANTPAGTYKIMAGLYNTTTTVRMILNPGPGVINEGSNRYTTGTLAVNTTPPAAPNGSGPEPAIPAIFLTTPSVISAQPGQTITLNFNWRLNSIPPNTQAFVHFVNSAGAVAFQADHPISTSTNPADLDKNGQVNVIDLSILLSNFGTTNTIADINKDGTVNVVDLSMFLSNFN